MKAIRKTVIISEDELKDRFELLKSWTIENVTYDGDGLIIELSSDEGIEEE